MRNLFLTLFLVAIVYSDVVAQETIKSPRLASLLDSMVAVDQAVQQDIIKASTEGKPQKEMKRLYQIEFDTFKRHQPILERVVKQSGFPGFKQVGEKGANNFWLLVQHCDNKPSFQKYVLDLMKQEVKRENADPYNYALLLDRVNVNTGKPQVYGTQVTYRERKAVPKGKINIEKVNKNRLSIGFDSLQDYLNSMTKLYQEMNPN